MIIISYSLNSRNKLIEQFMGMDRSTMLNIRVNWNFAVPVLEIVEMACTFNRQDDINPNINQRPDASTARTPSLVVTEHRRRSPRHARMSDSRAQPLTLIWTQGGQQQRPTADCVSLTRGESPAPRSPAMILLTGSLASRTKDENVRHQIRHAQNVSLLRSATVP